MGAAVEFLHRHLNAIDWAVCVVFVAFVAWATDSFPVFATVIVLATMLRTLSLLQQQKQERERWWVYTDSET